MQPRRMEVLPAIDLLRDRAVRLHQGDYGHVTAYGEPLELAARFAGEGARWLHVVDLEGARAGGTRSDTLRALVRAAAPARVQAAGGVRSVADAEGLIAAGASRVVVGTAAWALLPELVESLGERLVVALDVRDGTVRTRGWTESALSLDDAIDRCVASGVSRVLCTAIDRDGTLGGPDVAFVRRVVAKSDLPVLAAGGVRNEADLEALDEAGAEGAVVGRAVLEGRIALSPRT